MSHGYTDAITFKDIYQFSHQKGERAGHTIGEHVLWHDIDDDYHPCKMNSKHYMDQVLEFFFLIIRTKKECILSGTDILEEPPNTKTLHEVRATL